MEKPAILYVAINDNYLHAYANETRKQDYHIIPARLLNNTAESVFPHFSDAMAKLKQEHQKIDGVIIYDDSFSQSDPYIVEWRQKWKQAVDEIKRLSQPQASIMRDLGISFGHSEEGQPVPSEQIARTLDDIERLDREFVSERIECLQKLKNDCEFLLTQAPPSYQSAALIQQLRSDPDYNDIPIIVTGAFSERKQEFLEAGASAVQTTGNNSRARLSGFELLEETRAGKQPKTPMDHATRPTGLPHNGRG